MAEPAVRLFSVAEYLAQEQASLEKHEYFEGHILAMAGGTARHAYLISQTNILVGLGLRRGPCAIYSADLRVRVQESGLLTYPDLSVVCGALSYDPEDRHAITNPTVLFEVLSPSTERYDRGEKFHHYQKIPTLRDYVLVSSQEPLIEVYHRLADGAWRYTAFGPGELARVDSVGLSLPVGELYEGAPEDPPEEPRKG